MISNNIKETNKLARKVVEDLVVGDNLILLQGDLGAGKTTFSQGVLKYLGAEGPFTSPTFVIMKDYDIEFSNKKGAQFKKVFHLDCYRIKGGEVLDLGWEEIIKDKNNLVLVEWPENIKEFLPKKFIQIDFEVLGEDKRKIEVSQKARKSKSLKS